jgi:hypothetical protein
MGPVHPYGLHAPMLIGGPAASWFVETMGLLGGRVEVVDGRLARPPQSRCAAALS